MPTVCTGLNSLLNLSLISYNKVCQNMNPYK